MATIQQQLDEARAAYHALNTGTMARVVVDQNGERVEFVAANRAGLYNYIQELERKVCAVSAVPCAPNNGPARFVF